MFNIAKKLVKSFEQSVNETLSSAVSNGQDSYFHSIPQQLLLGNYSNDGEIQYSSLHGLRVLYCDEIQVQLQSFFDYIVGLNDVPLPLTFNTHGFPFPDYNAIFEIINSQLKNGYNVKFNVWSGKGGVYRDVYMNLQPQTQEDHLQEISLNNESYQEKQHQYVKLFDTLGFKVQWQPLIASTYTYHILTIYNQSGAAFQAGLIPQEDYIIGCQDGLLATGGENLLYDILQSKKTQDLVLYVYNSANDCVRPVTVHLDDEGRLGCNVGYGYLHRIPAPFNNSTEPIKATAVDTPKTISTEFTNENSDQVFQPFMVNHLKPSSSSSSSPSPFTTATTNIRTRKYHHSNVNSNNNDTNLLTDLVERDVDNTSNNGSSISITPPPIINKK
ncbi:related to GRASP65 homolog protein 1 [Saccharomycodes ludwigii]|uniref:Related to GRASP65 homolog protein 1 n=1 Tax=Saccharomycodes ludwigii TaxID=36035 RepID=A0A376B5N3_9ASCO|nr:related to GRASP65 homolog protein 1 [Saccharomycodes ludwigii]